MTTQLEEAQAFQALHQRKRGAGHDQRWIRILARSSGRTGDRETMLIHVAEIAAATHLPLSGDLENGYGHTPEITAEMIRLAAACGLVGGSIEDATPNESDPIYEIGYATERICAAVEAARSLSFPFTLCARAENFLYGRRDLKDTIARLQSYQEVGADVLYALGLTTKEEIAAVLGEIDRLLNVLAGMPGLEIGTGRVIRAGSATAEHRQRTGARRIWRISERGA